MISQSAFAVLIFAGAYLEARFGIGSVWLAGGLFCGAAHRFGWTFYAGASGLLVIAPVLAGAPLFQSVLFAAPLWVAGGIGRACMSGRDQRLDDVRSLAVWGGGAVLAPTLGAGLILAFTVPYPEAATRACALFAGLLCLLPAMLTSHSRRSIAVAVGATALTVLAVMGLHLAGAPSLGAGVFITGVVLFALVGTMPRTYTVLAAATVGAGLAGLHPIVQQPDTAQLAIAGVTTVVAALYVARLRNALLDSQDSVARRTARIRYLLQERDEVTALAVHDLQSPIQAIGGMQQTLLHMIETGHTDPPQMRRALEVAIATSGDLSNRVASVLSDKRPHLGGSGDTAAVATVIDHTIAAHRLALDARALRITRDVPKDVQISNAEDVKDVLDVVLDNAIVHSPERAEITIKVEKEADAPFLTIAISDAGPGIGAKNPEHLFRSPQSKTGTGRQGMGLFLAYRRTRSFGGTLTYCQPSTGGACFAVRVPVFA